MGFNLEFLAGFSISLAQCFLFDVSIILFLCISRELKLMKWIHILVHETHTHTHMLIHMIYGDNSDLSFFVSFAFFHSLLHMSNAHNDFCDHCVNRNSYLFLAHYKSGNKIRQTEQ